jgi:hypothetical protein
MRRAGRKALPAAATACIIGLAGFGLAGCLLDRPVIAPGNVYDPRLALSRDSLSRFDTVEVLLVDPEDSTVAIRLWKGPLASADLLSPHLDGDGRNLVYLVKGIRADRGHCYSERVSREGQEASVLVDTCASKPKPDPDPDPVVPDPKPDVPPKFLRDTLGFGSVDSVKALPIGFAPGSKEGDFEVTSSLPWIQAHPGTFHGNADTVIAISADRSGVAAGDYRGDVVLKASGKALDTVVLTVTVPKPVGRIQGTLIDWRDSVAQSGLTVTLDGKEPGLLSDSMGGFESTDLDTGAHVLSVTGTGRLGRIDTFTLAGPGTMHRRFIVAPAAGFKTVNIGWSHHAGHAFAAGGYGFVPSVDLDQAGSVMAFPLDNPSPSLQKFFPQGNDDGDPDFPEYFEAGEVVGDGETLYLAYPEGSRLVRIGNWKSAPGNRSVTLPFQPGGLLLDGRKLMALGRLADSTLVLAEFDAADLSLKRMDKLEGFRWDGALPDRRCPKLAAFGDEYFAVDGNGPDVKGSLLRIGRESRLVQKSVTIPDASINDLAIHDGMIYVTSMSSSTKTLRIYDADLAEAGSIATGENTDRIAFATEGPLLDYGFVTTDNDAILAIHPLSRKPVGRLILPGGTRPGRSISVDGRTGKVLVSDGDKLHALSY